MKNKFTKLNGRELDLTPLDPGNSTWTDNRIQFARFLAEAEVAGAFAPGVLQVMMDGMDLEEQDLRHIIGRAQECFDDIKSSLSWRKKNKKSLRKK